MDKTRSAASPPSPRPGRLERLSLVAFLAGFVLFALLPDFLYPARTCQFAITTEDFQGFTILHPVPWGSWYSMGGSGKENFSLPYMALLRLGYGLLGDRLWSMRLLSLLAAVLTVYFFYRAVRLLFPPAVGFLLLFLLSTSPIYLESMRAFGYQSLSQLAVALVCFFLAAAFSSGRPAAVAGMAAAAVSTLSLYIAARAVVALPVLFLLVYLRSRWRALLLYLSAFVGLVVLLEALWGDPLFRFSFYFVNPPEPGAEWVVDAGRFSPAMLADHLRRNLPVAGRYLLGIGRNPFADRDESSRLYNPIYLPFLLAGILLSLRARRPGHVLALLLFLLFFLAPLAASALQPQRLLLSLYPLNLFIALGLSAAWRFALRRAAPAVRPRLLAVSAGLVLLVAGTGDLGEYLLRVARPVLSLSAAALRRAAAALSDYHRETGWIRYHKSLNEAVIGNPYFLRHPVAPGPVAHLFGEEGFDARWNISHFMPFGESLLYLCVDPTPPTIAAAYAFGRARLGGLFSEIVIPGTALQGFLVRWDRIAQNVLFRPGTERMNSSGNLSVVERDLAAYNNEDQHFSLIDRRKETSWDILIAPGSGPGWVSFDHGEGKSSTVRSVSLRPAAGKCDRFFREAELQGSADGKSWRKIAALSVPAAPRTADWINWSFPNARPYRYHRLVIFPGNWSDRTEVISLGDILMFDRMRRDFQIESLL